VSDGQPTYSILDTAGNDRRRPDTSPNVRRPPEVDHAVTGNDATEDAGNRRPEREAAIVVSARAALTSFQYKSSEQLQQAHMHIPRVQKPGQLFVSIRVTKISGHGRSRDRTCKNYPLITMQNLVDLSHTVCAHVEGPKMGTLQALPLGIGAG